MEPVFIQCSTPIFCTISWNLSNPTGVITLQINEFLIPLLFSILMHLCCNTIFTWGVWGSLLHSASIPSFPFILFPLFSIIKNSVVWTRKFTFKDDSSSLCQIVQLSLFLREVSLHIKTKDLGATHFNLERNLFSFISNLGKCHLGSYSFLSPLLHP